MAYNGADGLPIREEVVDEPLPGVVITRNSYGALCLNTPNVLFADIDFGEPHGRLGCVGCWISLACLVAGVLVGRGLGYRGLPLAIITLGSFLIGPTLLLGAWRLGLRLRRAIAGSPMDVARRRVVRWCDGHPDWRINVYQTSRGLRLLALHALFDARSETATKFLEHVHCDPTFIRMCKLQACFLARVSPKPWRAGMEQHFAAGGTWPVTDPSKLARRRAWIGQYEQASSRFASCRFLERVGQGRSNPEAEAVRELHDRLCCAGSSKAMA